VRADAVVAVTGQKFVLSSTQIPRKRPSGLGTARSDRSGDTTDAVSDTFPTHPEGIFFLAEVWGKAVIYCCLVTRMIMMASGLV
jgi:hypothetical protein